jgi:hypothetical protein
VTSFIRAAFFVVFAAQLAACGKKIGDECKTAFDCNQTDENRTCDISQPGGYCILEGCDQHSCPDEAACVRFFPRLNLQDKVCDAKDPNSCGFMGKCIVYASGPVMLPDGGTDPGTRCAPLSSEIRRCVLMCDKDGDCRDGYECRTSGTYGSEALTDVPNGRVQFCSPRGP